MNKNNSLLLALLLPLAVACAGQESLLHRKPAAEGPVPVRVVPASWVRWKAPVAPFSGRRPPEPLPKLM